MRYVLIDEDGDTSQQEIEPTLEQLQQVAEGTLAILKVDGVPAGSKLVFKVAVVTVSEAEDEDEEDQYDLSWDTVTVV